MARDLGLHERFFLARTNVDSAPIVAFHARLQSPCTSKALAAAITVILARYPLLRCSVANPRTPHPTFEMREFNPDQILVVDESESERTPEDVLLRMIQDGRCFDMEQGPLWRVMLFGPTTIGFSIHHIISDGSGARSLFAQFLQLLRSPEDSPVPERQLPPTLEETMDIRPSWSQLLSTVFTDVVLSRLPALLRPTPPPPAFPNYISASPIAPQPRLLHLALPPTLLPRVKAAGKAHNVKTLHPIIHTVVLSALRIAAATKPQPLWLTGETPLSERSSALGHPRATGNYVSGIRDERWVTMDTPFWPTCRSTAARLVDPDQRARGKSTIGMLAYLPGGVVEPDSQGRARTGWEAYLDQKRGKPSGVSFEVSNLGLMEETELAEVCWAQTPSAVGAAVIVNVLSTRDGRMTMTITWWEGVLEEQFVRDFSGAMERLLYTIGEEETEDDASIGTLNRRT